MKRVKTLVDYSRGHKESHCGKTFEDDKGYCKHFIEPTHHHSFDLGKCQLVEGNISRVYWCKLYEKAKH
jgi:uncharacterized C2H2 Zn-finger protein